MKLGVITDLSQLSEAKWVKWDKYGFDEVELLIRPQTRSLINQIDRKAKANQKIDGLPEVFGDKEERKSENFTREMAKALVQDWRGVMDGATGEALTCNDKNKVLLFENLDIASQVIDEAKALASVRLDEEVKNSERSHGGPTAEAN